MNQREELEKMLRDDLWETDDWGTPGPDDQTRLLPGRSQSPYRARQDRGDIMTQHTPGPWKLNPAMDFSGTWDAWLGKDGVTIAHIQSHKSKELTTANARLIAAAPELLEALKGLCEPADPATDSRRWEAAKAAIAKAEGERS